MEEQKLTIGINTMKLNSITAFANICGRFQNMKKEVYFIRYIGFEEENKYLEEIKQMDRTLSKRFEDFQAGYLRLQKLENRLLPEQAAFYREIYEKRLMGKGELPYVFQNLLWKEQLEKAYQRILDFYQKSKPNISSDMLKNFGIRILFWIDQYFPRLFSKNIEMGRFPKLVYYGEAKLQEYFFFLLLTQVGCDVLYLNPEKDVGVETDALLEFSYGFFAKNQKKLSLPEWKGLSGEKNQVQNGSLPEINAAESRKKTDTLKQKQEQTKGAESQRVIISREKLRCPDREKTPKKTSTSAAETTEEAKRNGGKGIWEKNTADAFRKSRKEDQGCLPESGEMRELPYEELASFASSVVMIEGYNEQGQRIQSGSGVVINGEGYILTNFHVISGAASYGVRLEEDDQEHYTKSLIKYHPIYDLAILKIDRKCVPIPIYRGKRRLVRGQKVVAIGSPLGLFNSVSDGIISGFRKVDDVSMIQFTAPISHGSSGGAVLDLFGNLIGISTAGFDDGQNLNLAVDYQTVLNFARGFLC